MNRTSEVDGAWAVWYDTLKRNVLPLMNERKYELAIREIDHFLSPDCHAEIRSDALGFRARCSEALGNLNDAEADLMAARRLVGPVYSRYVHEIGLGNVCAKQNRSQEAVEWYRAALRTCISGSGISGGTALTAFIREHPSERHTEIDKSLLNEAANRSWSVLGLPGQFDPNDLERCLSAIRHGEIDPRKGR